MGSTGQSIHDGNASWVPAVQPLPFRRCRQRRAERRTGSTLSARLVLLASLAASGHPALAHGLDVDVIVDGSTIRGAARYSDQAPVANEPVRVFSPPESATPLAIITTAADGRFRFEGQAGGRYRLVLDAGEGHQVERIAQADPMASPGGVAPGTINRDELEKALLPLREDIERLRGQWRASDLIAAIGYVVGAFGLWRWRKRTS